MTAPTTLQQLLDHHAIVELRARYCRCLDQKAWEQFRELFTDDVVVDVGTIRATNADDFVAQVRARTMSAVTVHQCSMPEIDIRGVMATGVWAMSDYVDRGPGEWPDGLRVFRGFGHYYDEYRRTDFGWRISSIRVERLLLDVIARTD